MTSATLTPITEEVDPVSDPQQSIKAFLTGQLGDLRHRTVFSGIEVRDMLLDLWLLLELPVEELVEAQETTDEVS